MKLVRMKNRQMVNSYGEVDPNYAFVETVDTDIHEELTSYTDFDVFGIKTGKDYMFLRAELITKCATDGFSNLVDYDKKTVAKYAACSFSDAMSVLSVDERSYYNKIIVANLKIARAERIEKCRQIAGSMVLDGIYTYAQINTFLDDTESLFEKYIKGANPEFIYWLNSTNTYTLTGFESKSYYIESLKNKLLGIVLNGDA